jgi:hypothetical protein
MPDVGTGDDEYIGNSFNLRQLSFKLELRPVPVVNPSSWQSINSGNYISYRILLISPKSISEISKPDILSAYPEAGDMFQGLPSGYDFHTPFGFPGSSAGQPPAPPSDAPAFLLPTSSWQQFFIDRYNILMDFIKEVDLNQSQSTILVRWKSDKCIIQNLPYFSITQDDNEFGLFPWFKVLVIPIYCSGLARSTIFALSPAVQEVNFLSIRYLTDIYYTDS